MTTTLTAVCITNSIVRMSVSYLSIKLQPATTLTKLMQSFVKLPREMDVGGAISHWMINVRIYQAQRLNGNRRYCFYTWISHIRV